jgi:hypothetical protein
MLFECGLWSLELFSLGQQRLYVIRLRASFPRVILCNTRWPGIRIKRALPEIFHTYGMKFAPMDASGASQ